MERKERIADSDESACADKDSLSPYFADTQAVSNTDSRGYACADKDDHSPLFSKTQASGNAGSQRNAFADGDKKSRIHLLTLMGAGAGYGITPCAPLILMAGYAASLSPANALISGSVFAASSALSPLLILSLLSGVLSGKLRKEIPQYLDWFRLGAYLILIIIFASDMI